MPQGNWNIQETMLQRVADALGPGLLQSMGAMLEAYRGRGNNDPLASRDVEDIRSTAPFGT